MIKQEQGEFKGNLVENLINLHNKLTKAELEVGNLTEALRKIANNKYDEDGWIDDAPLYQFAQTALASSKPHLEKQLKEVERVLGVLRIGEWGNRSGLRECPCCHAGYHYLHNPHTKTCKLALLKTDLEQERDDLTKQIGEMK